MNSPEKISRAQGIKKAFQNLNIMVPLWSLAEMSRDYLKKKVLYNSDLSLMQPILLHKHALQMNAGIYGESTFHTCKNDRETLYRGKPQ